VLIGKKNIDFCRNIYLNSGHFGKQLEGTIVEFGGG